MRSLINRTDVNNTDPLNYPFGRIKDNTGVGDGTAINEATKGDMHQFFEKLMRLYDIAPNGNPDNETNGYQLIDALRGIATKNDFIHSLSTNGTVLSVGVKLTKMLENESIICICQFNKGAETQIKGDGSGLLFNLTYVGNFKTGEYVRLIKTVNGVSVIRLADWNSLDAMATELNLLKKASQVQEDAGLIDTVATTPLSNLTAFVKRVIGIDSVNYLANALRNGLYPKEHWSIVNGLGSSNVKNVGTFFFLDPGSSGVPPYGVSGDIVSAIAQPAVTNAQIVRVVVSNQMDVTLNYKVNISMESVSSDIISDSTIFAPIFKKITRNTFDIVFREQVGSSVQNLKIHLEVVQL